MAGGVLYHTDEELTGSPRFDGTEHIEYRSHPLSVSKRVSGPPGILRKMPENASLPRTADELIDIFQVPGRLIVDFVNSPSPSAPVCGLFNLECFKCS